MLFENATYCLSSTQVGIEYLQHYKKSNLKVGCVGLLPGKDLFVKTEYSNKVHY